MLLEPFHLFLHKYLIKILNPANKTFLNFARARDGIEERRRIRRSDCNRRSAYWNALTPVSGPPGAHPDPNQLRAVSALSIANYGPGANWNQKMRAVTVENSARLVREILPRSYPPPSPPSKVRPWCPERLRFPISPDSSGLLFHQPGIADFPETGVRRDVGFV